MKKVVKLIKFVENVDRYVDLFSSTQWYMPRGQNHKKAHSIDIFQKKVIGYSPPKKPGSNSSDPNYTMCTWTFILLFISLFIYNFFFLQITIEQCTTFCKKTGLRQNNQSFCLARLAKEEKIELYYFLYS